VVRLTDMAAQRDPIPTESPALKRLTSLMPLPEEDTVALQRAIALERIVPAAREIVVEGTPIGQPRIICSGWAYRARHFSDGRMQILGLLLPGELIGYCSQQDPLAATTIVSATPLGLCLAPSPLESSRLADVYAISRACEEFHLFRQIARLGCLSAYERTIDWLLEIHERLALAGLVQGDRFPVPLTQTLVAHLLGLTAVHLNRTLQTLRREEVLDLRKGQACLHDTARLADLVDYRSALVSRSQSRHPAM
jgi:CRP-like cAMP-binding protein